MYDVPEILQTDCSQSTAVSQYQYSCTAVVNVHAHQIRIHDLHLACGGGLR